MTSRRKGWLAFAAGALAAAAALGWATREALVLEREGARARAEAAFEERVRLALWRMDSYLAPIVAAEAVRPHFHYAPFYAEEDAFTRAWNDIPAGEVLVASPLLNYATPNGYIHFEVPPEGGVRSPQVPEGVFGVNAVPTYLTEQDLAAARSRLEELQKILPPEEIAGIRARAAGARMTELVPGAVESVRVAPGGAEALRSVDARPIFGSSAEAAGSAQGDDTARSAAEPVAPAPAIAAGGAEDSAPPRQAPGPLEAEQDEQKLMSGQEFSSRGSSWDNAGWQGAQSQFQVRRNRPTERRRSSQPRQGKEVPAGDEAATASPERSSRERPPAEKATPIPTGPAPAGSAEAVATKTLRPASEGTPDLPRQATASGSSERLVLGSLVPVWVGPGKSELVLVRAVERGGADRPGEGEPDGGRRYVQGIWLRWPDIREQLLAQVRDLLPAADLQAAPEGAPDPARALASVPASLDPGEVALAAELGALTPARIALAAAWAALAAALAASALSLRAANVLSDRRARFVSTVTHELRTPLTTFQLYTDMLASGMAPPESRGEYLATLKGESERLSLLVENVLAYARLEDGRVARVPAPVNARALVEGALGRSRERAEACGMRLEVMIAPDARGATALADSGAVEQILFNLVDNACKHAAPANGEAAVPDESRSTISVSAAVEGRSLVVRVADRGPGIPGGDRRRIFEPFHRAQGATAPGVGLGLALSRNLARAGGGDLACEPPPPEGGAVFALKVQLA